MPYESKPLAAIQESMMSVRKIWVLGLGCMLMMACAVKEDRVPPLSPVAAASDEEGVKDLHGVLVKQVVEPVVPVPNVTPASEKALTLLTAAEVYQGEEYVFGGRLGKRGCRRNGKPVRCREGIDCQSLIFFAFEDVGGKRWWDYSVMPTINVKRGELGQPVQGLDGVLEADLNPSLLAPGDVLFFLMDDYNLEVDGPLFEKNGHRYGTWHTGLFYGVKNGEAQVLHAAPGDVVKIQPLQDIYFDALFAVRI